MLKDQQADPGCLKCKDGYTSVSWGCVKTTVDGCMATLDATGKICQLCRIFEGWFANTDDGKCTKSSEGVSGNGDAQYLVDYRNELMKVFKIGQRF